MSGTPSIVRGCPGPQDYPDRAYLTNQHEKTQLLAKLDEDVGACTEGFLELRGRAWQSACSEGLRENEGEVALIARRATDPSHVNEHAHPALVDAATWEAAQHPRRAVVARRRDQALLAQLVRCAGCSLVMSPCWHPRREARLTYICQRYSAAGRCPAPALIGATYLEAYVEECFFELVRRRHAGRAPTWRAQSWQWKLRLPR